MNTIDEIFQLLEERAQASYFGEPVSQLEHALQCAYFALAEDAGNELIAAALLHDVGHLLHGQEEEIADRGIDAAHEDLAQSWLSRYFGPAVTRPIALHVAAKRYLCATDNSYLARLSPASLKSLQLQGGVMSAPEVANFESDEFAGDALRLRRWDDLARIEGKCVPSLSHYRGVLESVLKSSFRAAT
jgi:[1-hydroxy-2-(trimethylamino)ethyl]phosphonate dioxygenase